jgi:hypothetical protein
VTEPLYGWHDELDHFLRGVPEPRRGGTWAYCKWQEPVLHGVTFCMYRTKLSKGLKKYRQHYRRHHDRSLV